MLSFLGLVAIFVLGVYNARVTDNKQPMPVWRTICGHRINLALIVKYEKCSACDFMPADSRPSWEYPFGTTPMVYATKITFVGGSTLVVHGTVETVGAAIEAQQDCASEPLKLAFLLRGPNGDYPRVG